MNDQQKNQPSATSTPEVASSSRIFINHPLVISKLQEMISRQLNLNYQTSQQLIILCIGTDRSTGDALGPLVGSQLKKFSLPQIKLFGTLKNPVHASNLEEKITTVQHKHKNPFIIAIDASLGEKKSVGAIDVVPGPLQPGSGVDKELPAIGDLHVTGLVNVGGYMEHLVLQSTRLHFVSKMARKITYSLFHSLKKY